jgi:hypothetical protein
VSASARRCCERGECDRPVQHSPASVALQRSLGPLQPFSILVARQHGTRLVARTRGQRWHYRWRGLDHMRKYLTPMPAHRRGRTRSARDRELPSIERGRCLILQALCPPFRDRGPSPDQRGRPHPVSTFAMRRGEDACSCQQSLREGEQF